MQREQVSIQARRKGERKKGVKRHVDHLGRLEKKQDGAGKNATNQNH